MSTAMDLGLGAELVGRVAVAAGTMELIALTSGATKARQTASISAVDPGLGADPFLLLPLHLAVPAAMATEATECVPTANAALSMVGVENHLLTVNFPTK